MSYSGLAKTLLHEVGGAENVDALVHCATRLRFTLHSNENANKSRIQALDGILSVVESGGQFQVIIGSHVSHVYSELIKLLDGNDSLKPETNSGSNSKKTAIGSRIFEIVSGSFSPLISALAGAGMLKALLAVLVLAKVIDPTTSTFAILSAAANSIFYFLPVLLGVTAAQKMGANPFVGGAIGAALLEPSFMGLIGKTATFLGLPVVAINYSSTVFPVFIAVAILAILEKNLKRVCPHNLQMFLVPMISLMVVVPLTALVFGPFGVYVGNAIGSFLNYLIAHSAILTGAVVGGSMMFLVVLGLHWGIVPIIIANLGAGGDPISPMWAPCTFAQMGVALAIFLKSKDSDVKALAGPATLTGLLAGVTEPIIYGLIMRYRRTIPIVVVSGAIGGALNAMFHVIQKSFAFHSIFSIPVFTPIPLFAIGIAVSFGTAVVLTIVFGHENKE